MNELSQIRFFFFCGSRNAPVSSEADPVSAPREGKLWRPWHATSQASLAAVTNVWGPLQTHGSAWGILAFCALLRVTIRRRATLVSELERQSREGASRGTIPTPCCVPIVGESWCDATDFMFLPASEFRSLKTSVSLSTLGSCFPTRDLAHKSFLAARCSQLAARSSQVKPSSGLEPGARNNLEADRRNTNEPREHLGSHANGMGVVDLASQPPRKGPDDQILIEMDFRAWDG